MANPLILDLYVNNQLKTVTVADDTEPLLYVLRNQVGTKGVKFGCGVAQCGACTVIINGVTKRSCVTPLNTVANAAQVTTLEGLGQSNDPDELQEIQKAFVDNQARPRRMERPRHRLQGIQKAFVDNQAGQCAYCAAGIIMGSYNGCRGGAMRAIPRSLPTTK